MNPGRIREIVSHLKSAESDNSTVSEHNWTAAKLVWEEVQSGTKQVDLAEQIGKSQSHVTRLKKVWQVFVVDPGVEYSSFRDLGSFYAAYNSPEVHGESNRGSVRRLNGRERDGREGKKGKGRKPGGDFTASGMICEAYNLVSILARNPAFWNRLGDQDIAMLGDLPELADTVIRGYRAMSQQ